MSKRTAKLERQLDRLVGDRQVRRRRHRIKVFGITIGGPALFLAWLLPGVPPPGPFG